MPLSIHSASIGVMTRMLGNLSAVLDAAAAHAAANGIDPGTLIEARLAPDMFPLSGQVQAASDAAKAAGARLAGMVPPSFPDTETTFPELQDRIAKTMMFLESLDPLDVESATGRIVTLSRQGRTTTFRGPDYLRQMALPNFFFHVVTAYGILRAKGVPLGKLDYLGAFPDPEDVSGNGPDRWLRYG